MCLSNTANVVICNRPPFIVTLDFKIKLTYSCHKTVCVASTHTHTPHTHAHELSLVLCSPVSVALVSAVLEIHSSYRVATLCCFLTQVRACTQRHPRTHAETQCGGLT